MAIMYTYVIAGTGDNLGVFGSAKKAVRKGVEYLVENAPTDHPDNEARRTEYLAAVEALDLKELSTTLRNEGKLEFQMDIPGVGSLVRTLRAERFNLE